MMPTDKWRVKMQKSLIALAAAVAVSISGLVGPAMAQTVPTKGEVTKIDEGQQKITIKHEPIKNLDMDSMTMVFRVKDPSVLKQVKVGDKVTFEADRVNGALTVTNIKKGQ
jgi:Cu(I)/Ag(I) efflux system periplasmic protein CusF